MVLVQCQRCKAWPTRYAQCAQKAPLATFVNFAWASAEIGVKDNGGLQRGRPGDFEVHKSRSMQPDNRSAAESSEPRQQIIQEVLLLLERIIAIWEGGVA